MARSASIAPAIARPDRAAKTRVLVRRSHHRRHGGRIEAEPLGASAIESARCRLFYVAQSYQKITRFIGTAPHPAGRVPGSGVHVASFGQHRGDDRTSLPDSSRRRIDDELREARRQSEANHLSTQRREPAIGAGGPQTTEELLGAKQRRARRRVEPPHVRHIADARSPQGEHGFGEVGSQDLGRVVLGTCFEVTTGEEPLCTPRSESAGASSSLDRRRARNLRDVERSATRPGIVSRHARQARIDHGFDALDGDRGFLPRWSKR